MNTLLICGLQVTLVALVGIGISVASRRWLRTSGTLPLAATLVAVVLLTACALSPWPSWLRRPDQSTASPRVEESGTPAMLRDSYLNPHVAHFASVSTPLGTFDLPEWAVPLLSGSSTRESVETAVEGMQDATASTRWTGRQWLALFAGGAMLIGLIRVVGGLWAVKLFVRTSRPLKSPELHEQIDLLRAEMGCTKSVEIRECPQMATAATVGWRKPVVLLSESWQSWTPEQLRSVLAHEIAHITRGDFLATVAAQVGVVLHFYHPLVHWLANRLRLEQELAADAMAAKVVGGSRAYLNAIGELALKQSNESVGWPAHSFLPTRRTFLRRIEMLRDLKLLSGGTSRIAKWITLTSVAAVTLVAIGLRPPVGDIPAQVVQAQVPPTIVANAQGTAVSVLSQTATAPMEARYIPSNAVAVLVARADIITAQLDQLRKDKLIPEDMRVFDDLAGLVSVSAAFVAPEMNQRHEPVTLCATFLDKASRDAAAERIGRINTPLDSQQVWQKTKLVLSEYEVHSVTQSARFFPDDTTLVYGGKPLIEQVLIAGPKSSSPLTDTEAWKAATQKTIAIAVDAKGAGNLISLAPTTPIVGMFSSMWKDADRHTLGVSIGEKVTLSLVSEARDPAGAKRVEATERVAINFLTNTLKNGLNSPDPLIKKTFEELQSIVNRHKLETTGTQTTLSLEGDLLRAVSAVVTPSLIQARESARRAQQQNNMKQVMLALHNYHAAYGHFPPSTIIDKTSGIARSWRVEILPYIDGTELYEQYKKNEPWDSENNKKVLAQMPPVFRHPTQPKDSTNTSILAAYGRGLLFEENDHDGMKISEITDGTSNTIAIVEGQSDLPWTKPEDVVIDLSLDPLPEFGFTPDSFLVGFADGSVRTLSKRIDPDTLKALYTTNGREVIDPLRLSPTQR